MHCFFWAAVEMQRLRLQGGPIGHLSETTCFVRRSSSAPHRRAPKIIREKGRHVDDRAAILGARYAFSAPVSSAQVR